MVHKDYIIHRTTCMHGWAVRFRQLVSTQIVLQCETRFPFSPVIHLPCDFCVLLHKFLSRLSVLGAVCFVSFRQHALFLSQNLINESNLSNERDKT